METADRSNLAAGLAERFHSPMGQRIALSRLDRVDLRLAAGLVLLGLLSRLPFVGKVLYHWDSVNFAFALRRFDIAAGQPHAPGYILYVYLVRLVDLLFRDAQGSLVMISLASSALTLAAVYALGRDFYSRRVGLIAAFFLASSPLFWFYGEVALPHTLDALVVVLAVWMLFKVSQGNVGWILPASIWLGLAGGLRPQTQLFLMPLALVVGLRIGWQRALAASLAMVSVDLLWFIPLIASTGGLERYLQILSAYTSDFNSTTTVFGAGLWGLERNLRKLGMYSLYGWGLGALPAFLAVFRYGLNTPKWWNSMFTDRKSWFFTLWIAPVTAYYLLIHMGQQGLVFVFLPGLCLLSAAGLEALMLNSSNFIRRSGGQVLTLALVGGNSLIFLLAPTYPLNNFDLKLLTLDTLRKHDTYYLTRFEAIRLRFSPAHSLLLASQWRFLQYYLPEYTYLSYEIGSRWEQDAGLPLRTETVWIDPQDFGVARDSRRLIYAVLFEDELAAFDRSSDRLHHMGLPNGQSLAYHEIETDEILTLSPESIAIQLSSGAIR